MSPWISFILVGIILSLPQINNYDWIIDITVVFIVFPICVVIASKNNYTKFESILLMLGSASYPMYVLHKPFFELVSYLINGIEKSYTPYSGILLTIILIIFSVIIEKNYDIPVRKKITQYFFKKIR